MYIFIKKLKLPIKIFFTSDFFNYSFLNQAVAIISFTSKPVYTIETVENGKLPIDILQTLTIFICTHSE